MPKVHRKADPEVVDRVNAMLLKYHPKLVELKIRVGVIMTRAGRRADGSLEGPSVVKNGVACAAVTRLTSLKERVFVDYDAIIEIDEDMWDFLNPAQKDALVDHELQHIIEVYKDGFPDTYDDGRPKLKLLLDDWALTGFHIIVERHGEAALEWGSVFKVMDALCSKQNVGTTGAAVNS